MTKDQAEDLRKLVKNEPKHTGDTKVISITSGKGGVGKSTISANMAYTLAQKGFKVGLLDADVYGPNVPRMLQLDNESLKWNDNNKMIPAENYGIKIMSVALTTPAKDTPLVWRSSVAVSALIQFLDDVEWGKLDYLVIDMPPGTGDVHLTIANEIKPNGVFIVTTPQEVVWGDVKRSLDQIVEKKFPILGIIENMSYTICEKCNHINHPFHSIKDEELPKDIKIVAKIPLTKEISESSDTGVPIIVNNPESEISKIYLKLVEDVLL